MGIFKKLIASIGHALGFYRLSHPHDIPKKLSEKARTEAMNEARWLHGEHRIMVSELAPGELPSLPKRADQP
jgi:hypothetical protein